MRIFLTGSSSGVARALLPVLCPAPWVTQIVGLDPRPSVYQHPKLITHVGTVQSTDLHHLMHGCQAVIHVAYAVLQGEMSEAQLYDNNVLGAQKIFDAADQLGIIKVINLSSVSVYGSGLGLAETAPMHPTPGFVYAMHKADIERYAASHIIHLRTHFVLGPHAQPFLRQLCQAPFYLRPARPWPQLQVVHEDDVACAIMGCLQRDVHGAFNIAAPQTISLPQMMGYPRRWLWPLPLPLVQGLRWKKKGFHWLDTLQTNLTVQCQKAQQQLGWQAQYDPWQARSSMLASAYDG